jgi:hypothetical protein
MEASFMVEIQEKNRFLFCFIMAMQAHNENFSWRMALIT